MPISRLYTTAEDATAAARGLREAGLQEAWIQVIRGAASPDSLIAAGVSPARAPHHAERLSQGAALVVVDAPLGTGATATRVLERAGPGDADGPPETFVRRPPRDPAAPLSSALQIPVLLPDPAPFSAWLGWRLLSEDPAPLSARLGHKTRSDDPAPLSSRLGWRLLSPHPAPLSARLGWRTRLPKAAPLSDWLGKPTLSDQAAPLSRWLGLRVLSPRARAAPRRLPRDPAPFSSLLGLPVLLKNRSSRP